MTIEHGKRGHENAVLGGATVRSRSREARTGTEARLGNGTTGITSSPVAPAVALSVVLPATAAAVPSMRSHAREFAASVGAEERVVDDVALAVSEAATNVVLHGYREAAGATIELRGRIDGEMLELAIADRGDGFRPGPIGGLGLGLRVMERISDSMKVIERDEGVTIVLGFALHREARA